MRSILIILIMVLSFTAFAQTTSIPDPKFEEALINAGVDSGPIDGEVSTSSMEATTELNVSAFNITDLTGIEACINLEEFICSENPNLLVVDVSQNIKLTYLEATFTGITNIDLSQNPLLNNLKVSATNLTELDLSQNPLITNLDCGGNGILNLDLSPCPLLRILYCNYGQLTNLDVSQNPLLEKLYCEYSQLLSLDLSQNPNLTHLRCTENNLVSLNLQNGSVLSFIEFFSNPNLIYICVDDSELIFFQDKIDQYGWTDCEVNTICDFSNNTFAGSSFYDIDSNGCDTNDIPFPFMKFNITGDSINGNFIPSSSGDYFVTLNNGNYTVTPQLETPTYFNVSPSSVSFNFPLNDTLFNQNFCITPNDIHNDLEVILVPLTNARPGEDSRYKLIYRNKGTHALDGSIGFTYDGTVMDFVSATPSFDGQINSTLSKNFNQLQPFESKSIEIKVNLNTPLQTPPLDSGDELTFIATVSPFLNDETVEDNTFELNQLVVNSLDPNDITCLEGDTILPEEVSNYVHYKIRFENLGTADALNILIKDIIDTSKFDISTLVPIDASHTFRTQISNINEVKFIFEDINLPFDTASNKGYVVFKIRTLPTLVEGDFFENQAEIYFDFNAPIITNIATTYIQSPPTVNTINLINDATVRLFPNPTNGEITIKAQNIVNNTHFNISIFNMQGLKVFEQFYPNVNSNYFETNISLSELPNGVYFVKINDQIIRLVFDK